MKRPAFWITIFMICGIYCRLGVSKWVCLICFIFPLVSISYFVIKYKKLRYVWFLLMVALGFILAHISASPTVIEKAGGSMQVTATGYITDIGTTSGGYPKLRIHADMINLEDGNVYPAQTIYVIDMQLGEHEIGEGVILQGEAMAFSHADLYGGYDEWQYLTAQGYTCKMFPDVMEKTGEQHQSVATLFFRWNQSVQHVLERMLPAEQSAIAKAMLTGNRDDIDRMTETLYTKAGVTHILCISGLHMSILAACVAYLLERYAKCSLRTSAIVTIFACWFFLLFTGFAPSSMRAVVMITIASFGRVFYRKPDWLNSIALAALVILCLEPLYLFQAGFQLSFLSVIGIYMGSRVLPEGETWYAKLGHMAGISAFASGFGLPVAAYHFSDVSTVAVLSNMVILPLSGILLGMIILSAIAGLLWLPAGVFLSGTVYAILKLFEGTCWLVTQIPYSYISVGRMPVFCILLLYGLAICCCLYRPRWQERSIVVGTTIILLCAMVGNRLYLHQNQVMFLDVGQGDAAVITTSDHKAYVIDGGGVANKEIGANTGVTVLEPYLASKGIERVEAVFLTHFDTDHCLGILELLQDMPVGALYLPAAEVEHTEFEEIQIHMQEVTAQKQIPIYTLKQGDVLQEEHFGTLTCFGPPDGMVENENQRSLVLQYQYGDTKILFTGDCEAEGEYQMMQSGMDLQSDILKVAHHGSATSSLQTFLETVAPTYSIISCGENNWYGHPHPQTIEKLEKIQSEILRTDKMGSIEIQIAPDTGYTIQTAAERIPWYERIKKSMETK